jgi:hypothetical protein
MYYLCLGLGDIVPSNLDPWLEEGLGHLVHVDAQQVGDLLGDCVVGKNSLKWGKYKNEES